MRATVSAVNDGGALPGEIPGSRLVALSTRYRADITQLQDAVDLARERGVQGFRLPEGRVLVTASLRDMMSRWPNEPEQAIEALEATRAAAIRRARIDSATHHLVGNSGDTAARSPTAVPLAIFPLDPTDRADLICDLMTFEMVVSLDQTVEAMEQRRLSVEVLLPQRNQQVPQYADVLRISFRDRSLTVHAPAMNPLLFELLRPSAWCDGIAELLKMDNPPTHPDIVLANEEATWR